MNQQDSFRSSTVSDKQGYSFWQYSKVLDYVAFFSFLVLLAVGMWRHELSADELHSWNLARSSISLTELFTNMRYEGVPPYWCVLLFLVCKITPYFGVIKVLHFIIVCAMACLLVFRMHIYSIHKLLILAGYFFLYEYGVMSRNYSLAIVFALGIVLLRNRDSRYDAFFYYMLLFFLSATHLHGLFLGLALHFAFTIKHFSTWYSRKAFFEMFLGILVVVPVLYFVFAPSDGGPTFLSWKSVWSFHSLKLITEAPLKAFLPVPAWWEHHVWNTEFLITIEQRLPIFRLLNLWMSFIFLYLVYYVLKPHRLSLNVFFVNLFLTVCFAWVFPSSDMRWAGFIYVGFIVSLLIGYHTLIQFRLRRIFIWMLLVLQVIAVIPVYTRDIKHSFSQSQRVDKMIRKIDPSFLVADPGTLNYITAVTRQPVFCAGYNKTKEFLLWDRESKARMGNKTVYSDGVTEFFRQHSSSFCYLLTTQSLEALYTMDAGLYPDFELELLESATGAIEKYSDLYLFKISQKQSY